VIGAVVIELLGGELGDGAGDDPGADESGALRSEGVKGEMGWGNLASADEELVRFEAAGVT
jgi:hypothetical protein